MLPAGLAFLLALGPLEYPGVENPPGLAAALAGSSGLPPLIAWLRFILVRQVQPLISSHPGTGWEVPSPERGSRAMPLGEAGAEQGCCHLAVTRSSPSFDSGFPVPRQCHRRCEPWQTRLRWQQTPLQPWQHPQAHLGVGTSRHRHRTPAAPGRKAAAGMAAGSFPRWMGTQNVLPRPSPGGCSWPTSRGPPSPG